MIDWCVVQHVGPRLGVAAMRQAVYQTLIARINTDFFAIGRNQRLRRRTATPRRGPTDSCG